MSRLIYKTYFRFRITFCCCRYVSTEMEHITERSDDVLSKTKQLEEEAKRKATEDDDNDEPESTSEDSGLDDDVFYDSDVSEQEEE